MVAVVMSKTDKFVLCNKDIFRCSVMSIYRKLEVNTVKYRPNYSMGNLFLGIT